MYSCPPFGCVILLKVKHWLIDGGNVKNSRCLCHGSVFFLLRVLRKILIIWEYNIQM